MAERYKIDPSQWVSLIYQVQPPELASALALMLIHCLEQKGLPDDSEAIADLTRQPLETILAVRNLRCVQRASTTEQGKLFFNVVSEMLAERATYCQNQSRLVQRRYARRAGDNASLIT